MLPLSVLAQPKINLTDDSQVSLITCGSGQELYEAFGHTAIRVYDPNLGFDLVYNYGTFDFNQPNFYWNFVTGRSMYRLSTSKYSNFVRAYEYYNRSVREQVLDMSLAQRQRLMDKLSWNAMPENREYLYDYFFDNCSTRPRDILLEALDGEVQFDTTHLPSNRLSIRDLTDLYIVDSQPWGDLGIDLCLGTRIDQPATAMQYMYLPEELEKAFDNAYISENGEVKPLVVQKNNVFEAAKVVRTKSWFVPQIVFVALLLFSAVFLTIFRVVGKSTRIFDGLVFMITSFIGFNGVFLWFFTNHYAADYNWNILWALPTNTVFGYALMKKKRPSWTRNYALFLIILYGAMLVGWNYIPQLLHYSLRFMVVLLLFIAVGVFRTSGKKTAITEQS